MAPSLLPNFRAALGNGLRRFPTRKGSKIPKWYKNTDYQFIKCIRFCIDIFFSELLVFLFSPNSVFNTWGSYGSGKRPGC